MYKVPKIHITNVALHTKVYSHKNYSLNANKELYKNVTKMLCSSRVKNLI